jgi:hypothetical protein
MNKCTSEDDVTPCVQTIRYCSLTPQRSAHAELLRVRLPRAAAAQPAAVAAAAAARTTAATAVVLLARRQRHQLPRSSHRHSGR